MVHRLASIAAFSAALACAATLRAQDGMTKATAEALFADGKRLMTAGDFAQACPKFAASQKLDPGIGTVLNLADCFEKLGRTASAWAEFRSASSAARAAGSLDRAKLADERAAALEGRLSYLTITSSAAKGVQIKRDDLAVEPAVLGTPIPVDPGKHVIEAVSAGKPSWSVSIDVSVAPSRVTVNVPELGEGTPAPGVALRSSTPGASKDFGAVQRGVGIGVGVLGVIGVAAGTVFGLKAGSNWDEARSRCSNYPEGCDAAAVSQAQDAKAAGNIATVAFVLGGVGLVGGAVLFFTAPKNPSAEKTLALRILPSGVTLTGGF